MRSGSRKSRSPSPAPDGTDDGQPRKRKRNQVRQATGASHPFACLIVLHSLGCTLLIHAPPAMLQACAAVPSTTPSGSAAHASAPPAGPQTCRVPHSALAPPPLTQHCLQVLPKMARSQRCGQCDTCLNPQKKKACLVARARLVEDLNTKGDLPLSLLSEAQKPPATKQPAPKRPKAPSDTPSSPTAKKPRGLEIVGAPRPAVPIIPAALQQPGSVTLGQALAALTQGPLDHAGLEQLLEGVLTEDGRVPAQHMRRFAAIMQAAPHDKRYLLLWVLHNSRGDPAASRGLVNSPGLPTMQAWLQEAVADLAAGSNRKVVVKGLEVASHCLPLHGVSAWGERAWLRACTAGVRHGCRGDACAAVQSDLC